MHQVNDWTVVIADRHPLIRNVLKEIVLHAGYRVIAEVANASALMDQLQDATVPDIILLNTKLPDTNFADLCRAMKQQYHDCRILAFSFDINPNPNLQTFMRSNMIDSYINAFIHPEQLTAALQQLTAK